MPGQQCETLFQKYHLPSNFAFFSPSCDLCALTPVSCHSTPMEACTIISDPTCQIAQNRVCSPVAVDGLCLLSVRRAFNGSGTYCVNFTLGDDASLALTSTLISIPGKGEVCL